MTAIRKVLFWAALLMLVGLTARPRRIVARVAGAMLSLLAIITALAVIRRAHAQSGKVA